MIIGEVKGNVWSTSKEESLNGLKLMIIQRIDLANKSAYLESFIAVDCIGAGIGERVLITQGSSARLLLPQHQQNAPIDAAIVGILDESQWDE